MGTRKQLNSCNQFNERENNRVCTNSLRADDNTLPKNYQIKNLKDTVVLDGRTADEKTNSFEHETCYEARGSILG
jgi:hypothetical protein